MTRTKSALAEGPKNELTTTQKFVALVEKEMQAKMEQGLNLSDFQKRLIQNYFIAIDKALTTAEEARMRKSEQYRDKVTVGWNTIDMKKIATDVVHFSRLGLDPCQKNHLFVIPFKNNKTGLYDVNFMPGYNGLELITKKYALEVPLGVTVELVCQNDVFKPYKRGKNYPCDDYEFDIPNPFDRGNIVGGFAYIQYREPEKNRLIIMTLQDILKRKNSGQGNVEFWGGEKDEWADGKKTGKKKKVEGWYEEMCLKTIKRKVYGGTEIPLDPRLIDDTYKYIKQRELDAERAILQDEICENANSEPITIEEYEIDADTGEMMESAPEETEQIGFDMASEKAATHPVEALQASKKKDPGY